MRTTPLLLGTWLAIAAAGSCHAPQPGVPAGESSGCGSNPKSSGPSATAPSSAALSARPVVKLPFEAERGCAGDIDATKPADAQLEEMGTLCVRGLEREAGVKLEAGEGGTWRGAARVGAFACVRVGIASEAPGAAVEATLTGADGAELGTAKAHTPLLLGRDGPICVREAGELRLVVRELGAPAGVRAAVWIGKR